jgi:hypothetical protein
MTEQVFKNDSKPFEDESHLNSCFRNNRCLHSESYETYKYKNSELLTVKACDTQLPLLLNG